MYLEVKGFGLFHGLNFQLGFEDPAAGPELPDGRCSPATRHVEPHHLPVNLFPKRLVIQKAMAEGKTCLLYTSDAADE